MSMPGPPAGWYPDPGYQGGLRWWDGVAWSAHTSTPTIAPSLTPGATPARSGGAASGWHGPVPAALAAEETMTSWARYAVLVSAVIGVANGVVLTASMARWKNYFHWLRLIIDSPQRAQTLPRPPAPSPPWIVIIGALGGAAQIVYLIWQYRAAVVARELGYRSRRSPGWGVGSCFVPVVDLWMPYQAVRDCLPPGHRARSLVLGTWLLLVSCAVLGVALEVTLVIGGGLSSLVLVVLIAAELGWGLSAFRMIAVIGAQHREATAGLGLRASPE